MTTSSSSSRSSNTTFHPFPYLPWELRARIWELTISPRIIKIYVGQVRQLSKREIARCSALKLSSKLLRTSTPAPAALHACQEARNHLTDHVCGAKGYGYYEKMSYWDMKNAHKAWWAREEKIPTPYVWVNFEVDMIDIGLERFTLPRHYASKIKRVKYTSSSPFRAFEVLVPGEYCFSGVKEAEIECFHEVASLANGLWWELSSLVCGVEGVVCIDSLGKRKTLEEVWKEWKEDRRAWRARNPEYDILFE